MFMLPSAIIKCRDGLEFAQAVQFARKYIDSTFFQGCSTNSLIYRWHVESRGLDCQLCVRIEPENEQSKVGWNTENFFREAYPHLRQINIEDYDIYACYADIMMCSRFYEDSINKTVRQIKENEMEKNQKYFDYLEALRQSGVTNMMGAVPYLQNEFPELRSDRKRAQEILLDWMRNVEGGAAE